MRQILSGWITCVLLVLALSVPAYAAGEATVSDNEDFVCPVEEANDLHIEYSSDTAMELVNHVDDGFPMFTRTPSPDHHTWQCTWSGKTVHKGESVHVGVTFTQQAKNYLNKTGYWTLNGQKVGDDIPGLGFKVEPPMGRGDLTYTLINPTPYPLTIRNLQLRVSSQVTPLPSMTYPVRGLDPNEPGGLDFVLDGKSSRRVPLVGVPALAFPFYVVAQGQVFSGADRVSQFVQQHQHVDEPKIPAVSQWGLIIMTLLVAGTGAVVLVRRRYPSTM